MVATGVTATEAYIYVGYSKSGAAASANRTLKIASVSARVKELQEATNKAFQNSITFDRDRVLSRLDKLSREADEAKQFSAAARCEELIGRAIGIFVERSEQVQFDWNKLPLEVKAKLTAQLEELAFKDNPAGLEAWRKGEPKEPVQ